MLACNEAETRNGRSVGKRFVAVRERGPHLVDPRCLSHGPVRMTAVLAPSAQGTLHLRRNERTTLGLISVAHLVSHVYLMAIVALFPFLRSEFGIGFIELGFALSTFSIVSMVLQTPMGMLVDRIGSRPLLIAALTLGGASFVGIGIVATYPALLLGMVLAGIANAVYHPADYSILSSHISAARIGRAFSIHTFSGYIGGAMTPPLTIYLASVWGTPVALITAGVIGLVVAILLALRPMVAPNMPTVASGSTAKSMPSPVSTLSLLTFPILSLTLFFALLSLSGSSVANFSVVALMELRDGLSLVTANAGLTAYLFMGALGVLMGGILADRTSRHAQVATIGLVVVAVLTFVIGTYDLGGVVLIMTMGAAGACHGMISPSRDMLVRQVAPPGAAGRVFGIVTTGFGLGGAVGPMLYGWIMDQHAPVWVFYTGMIFMALTVVLTVVTDRNVRRRGRPGTEVVRNS